MYRCTECKEEYDIKPDYCRCGNDLFEEFTPVVNKTDLKNSYQAEKLQPALSAATILSVGFFIICIILAIVPWLIKEKRPSHNHLPAQEKPIKKDIPDIENIWNDSINTKSLPPIPERKAVKVIDNTVKNQTAPIAEPKTSNIKPPVKTKPQKPVQKAPSQNKSSVKNKPSAQPQPEAKKNPPIKLPPSVLNPSQTKPAPAPPPAPKMNQAEFQKYKGSIRAAFAARLNLTNVHGEGECAVEFSVDSNGKLVNRKFIYKSNNSTVNDEVYYMLMRLPNFKTPPANYNGEKIRFKIYLNNTYYEISYM